MLQSISAAQLCLKHNQVDPELLKQVFERLVKQIQFHMRMDFDGEHDVLPEKRIAAKAGQA